jgi:glutamyl-tRNA synthetase
MSVKKIKDTARIYALQNAVQFNVKANSKAVIGKVISLLKKYGYSPNDIIFVVNEVVNEVNKIDLEKQKMELEELAPKLLVKEKKERDFTLPPLPDAKEGKVVTRFPPEPNGYLHIGHAKAAIVDSEYAKMYHGKFILRFDDTNPENVHPKFYSAQKEDLEWLGISWEKEYNTSDNLEKHYKFAEKLINQGDAYVCTCSSDDIKHNRYHGMECKCRSCSCDNSLDQWKEMHTSLNDAILRLRGDICCVNTAMRDPTLFRIIDAEHPIQGDKYRVWPTYDFAGAVEDSLSGVTHSFRTKEYELRDECYFKLLDLLGLRKPCLLEFARLSIEGMPVSKRKIKPLIDKGLVSGFDDIRLPTLRGIDRRGIRPNAVRRFVLSQGISKVESTTDFSILESENRKLIDPVTKRYYFVNDPIGLKVEHAPEMSKEISFHPSNNDLGSRVIKTSDTFFVPRSDMDRLEIGSVFRLKDLYNVKIISKDKNIIGEYLGEKLIPESAKIQWTTESYVETEIFVPKPLFINDQFNENSLQKIHGYAEQSTSKLKKDEIVQFERFGFVKIHKLDDKLICNFTHK